jgi:hypothetical protein
MSMSSPDQACGPLTHAGGVMDRFKSDLNAFFATMGPRGRRYALTAIGAILALGLGAGAASVLRLPSDPSDPAAPDQTAALDELPAAAAARTFALGNPPTLAVAAPAEPPVQLASLDPVIPADDEPVAQAPSDDLAAPAQSAPAPADTTDAAVKPAS